MRTKGETGRIGALDTGGFKVLSGSQPWIRVRHWNGTYYQ